MRYQIIPEKCIACGLCQVKAPNLFDYHDNGIVKWLNTNEDSTQLKSDYLNEINSAIKSCPTKAILAHVK